jgi:hypothetical protein|tara:strand:+ start:1447 stop:1581 length:135 start_codon:yes stop_codon:yes gene_type:complete
MKDLRDVTVGYKNPQRKDQQLTMTLVVSWTLLAVTFIALFIWQS